MFSGDSACVLDVLEHIITESATAECIYLSEEDIEGFETVESLSEWLCERLSKMPADYSSSKIVSSFKRNPEAFMRSFSDTKTFSTLRAAIKSACMKNPVAGSTYNSALTPVVKLVVALCGVNFISVRFAAACTAIMLVPILSSNRTLTTLTNLLVGSLSAMSSDVCDAVRGLIGFAFISGTVGDVGTVPDDLLCGSIQSLLADPCTRTRARTIKFITAELGKHRSCSRIRAIADRIGAFIVSRCFDVDEGVAIAALRLISTPEAGELLLGDEEALYQKVSNLVWYVPSKFIHNDNQSGKGGSDPFKISREALVFINNHIMSSPGILTGQPGDQELATVIEFLIQYSDGHMSGIRERFVATLLSYFGSKNLNCFICDPNILVTYIQRCVHQLSATEARLAEKADILARISACVGIIHEILVMNPDRSIATVALIRTLHALVGSNELADLEPFDAEAQSDSLLRNLSFVTKLLLSASDMDNTERLIQRGLPSFTFKELQQVWDLIVEKGTQNL